MQHPDHPIVNPVTTPSLVCVAMFDLKHQVELESTIFTPKRFTFTNWEEAYAMAQQGLTKGLVIKYNNMRAKIRNTAHHSMENLKENVPFLNRYASLRQKPMNLIEYFKAFPRDMVKGQEIEIQIQSMIKDLYQWYRTCFVYKKEKAREHAFSTYLYDLHGIYLQELYPIPLSKKRVDLYVNHLSPKRLSFLLTTKK